MNVSFPIVTAGILLKCIPQRNPIVMVDALIAFSTDKIIAGLTIGSTGLFIINEELSEPGLIEHMAQTIALHTGFGYFIKEEQAPVGYIGSISNLTIKRLPKKGERIISTASILHEFSGVTLVDIISTIDEEVIALGQMKTVIAR